MSVKRIVLLFGIIVGVCSIVGAAERQVSRQDCRPHKIYGGTAVQIMDAVNKDWPINFAALNLKHDGKGWSGDPMIRLDQINEAYPINFAALNLKHDGKGWSGDPMIRLDQINKAYPPQYPCRN